MMNSPGLSMTNVCHIAAEEADLYFLRAPACGAQPVHADRGRRLHRLLSGSGISVFRSVKEICGFAMRTFGCDAAFRALDGEKAEAVQHGSLQTCFLRFCCRAQ